MRGTQSRQISCFLFISNPYTRMKKNPNRRQFLKSSFTAVGAFFISNSPLKSFANSKPAEAPDPLPDARLLYTQAKDLFYRKEYAQSSEIYQQLIQSYPDRYIYYDGYGKVLGAQQQLLQRAELYREGWLKNPDHPYFAQRLALSIYDVCMGHRKAEIDFCRIYGEELLFETSARLMMQAIRLKADNKGFYFSLLDIVQGLDKKNLMLERRDMAEVTFSEDLRLEIKTLTADYKSKWEEERASRKAGAVEDVDSRIIQINSRSRRNFYIRKEKTECDKAIRKSTIAYRRQAMLTAIERDLPARVERYSLAILEENPRDTDTIGKARKYYRKKGHYDKIITLNRYLCFKNDSTVNKLALAGSLSRYGNTSTEWNEAKQLLNTLADDIDSTQPVYLAGYCIASARAYAKTKDSRTAVSFLLQGLEEMHEYNAGTCYVLMEQYARIVYEDSKKSAGKDVLKTLSRNDALAVDIKKRTAREDPVWKYVDSYLSKVQKKEQNTSEQLKPLYALKSMLKAGSKDYNTVVGEIEASKS